jgi:hypothetical protein
MILAVLHILCLKDLRKGTLTLFRNQAILPHSLMLIKQCQTCQHTRAQCCADKNCSFQTHTLLITMVPLEGPTMCTKWNRNSPSVTPQCAVHPQTQEEDTLSAHTRILTRIHTHTQNFTHTNFFTQKEKTTLKRLKVSGFCPLLVSLFQRMKLFHIGITWYRLSKISLI